MELKLAHAGAVRPAGGLGITEAGVVRADDHGAAGGLDGRKPGFGFRHEHAGEHLALRVIDDRDRVLRRSVPARNIPEVDAWYVPLAEGRVAELITLDGRLGSAPGPRCAIRTPSGDMVSSAYSPAQGANATGATPVAASPMSTSATACAAAPR